MRGSIVLAAILVTASSAPALATPADDVKNAFVNFAQLSAYHLTLDANGKHGEGDVVAPDKMQLTIGPTTIVRIGTNTWVQVGGHWMQLQAAGDQMSRMTGGLSEAQSIAANPKDVTVTDLGMKTVDGETVHAYSVQSKGKSTPSTVYVGSDGRVHGVDTTDSQGKISTVRFSKFNETITIAPPSM